MKLLSLNAELDVADLEYRISELENQRVLISNYIKNIEESIKETAQVKGEKLLKIYESANIEIPEMVKKNIDEVLQFHTNLLAARNTRLRRELNKQKAELQEIDEKISALGQRMDEFEMGIDILDLKRGYFESTEFLESIMSKQSIANSVNIN